MYFTKANLRFHTLHTMQKNFELNHKARVPLLKGGQDHVSTFGPTVDISFIVAFERKSPDVL